MSNPTFTVALVGADGAGKTTIARHVEQGKPLRVKYLYMGVNPEANGHTLPTTRLVQVIKRALGRPTHQGGPPDPSRRRRPRGPLGRAAGAVKSNLRVANQMAEEWFRQALAWWYRRRGFIVLFDRHYYCDHYAHEVAGPRRGDPLMRRVHGLLLRRVYPKPDLLIVLDAPAAVLFSRKGEGTPDLLERRRREYLDLAQRVPHVTVVDAARPQEDVARDVVETICSFRRERTP
jgi:thymidylate kinase